jgi:hypothetical protein
VTLEERVDKTIHILVTAIVWLAQHDPPVLQYLEREMAALEKEK